MKEAFGSCRERKRRRKKKAEPTVGHAGGQKKPSATERKGWRVAEGKQKAKAKYRFKQLSN